MSGREWLVYRLINNTKREIYHGVTKHSLEQRIKSHCAGNTKALEHWDCTRDDISVKILARGLTQINASSHAHEEERQCYAPGYKLIKTAGI